MEFVNIVPNRNKNIRAKFRQLDCVKENTVAKQNRCLMSCIGYLLIVFIPDKFHRTKGE